LSSIPGWVNAEMDEWGNWHIDEAWIDEGWSEENILYNLEKSDHVPGSKILMKSIPRRIRRTDLVIARLKPPYPNICKAKYWFHRWPLEHPRAGQEIYDSDRAAWFKMGAGWFKSRLRRAKIQYMNVRNRR